MSNIDTGIIFAYLAMMIVLGLYASRQHDSIEGYFVASGRIGTISIACLWIAGWIGGAAIIGGAAKAYEIGISAGWYIVSMAIGCMLFGLFFAARVKRLGAQHNFLTYPEIMESRYDRRTRIVATITTIAAYVGYAAGQIAAAALVLQTLLDWSYVQALLVASGIIILYTATGGFLAITYTDWVQVGILFVGVAIIGIPVAIASGGNWSTFTTSLPESYFNIGSWGWPTILAMIVSIVLSFFTAMDSYTRCFAAKSEHAARVGALLASVLLIPLMVGAIWLGLASKLLFPDMAEAGDVLTRFVFEQFPVGLKGILLVGMLAAVMSTADICILTASANLTRDIYQRHINPDVAPKKLFRMSMLASVIIGTLAALLAWQMRDIVDILLVAFTINSAALFLPSVAMVYFEQVDKNAAFWSITCSLVTVLGWYVLGNLQASEIFSVNPLWPGLIVSVTLFSLLTFVGRERA
jgi:SSS family solute:Na+ symporter